MLGLVAYLKTGLDRFLAHPSLHDHLAINSHALSFSLLNE
jgi:hypothetical protein